MGAAAAELSDLAFVTSDNPRDEDPLAIIEEVLGGVAGGRTNPGRSWSSPIAAWPSAWRSMRRRPGDVVVIAGKGHETYQEVAGRRLPFDDAVEARRALSARFGSDPRTWVPSYAAAPVGATVAARPPPAPRDAVPEA